MMSIIMAIPTADTIESIEDMMMMNTMDTLFPIWTSCGLIFQVMTPMPLVTF